MKTITLHYSESIAEKLNNFLGTFSKEDLKVEDTEQFQKIKSELDNDYELYLKDPKNVLSVDDAEKEMNLFLQNNEG